MCTQLLLYHSKKSMCAYGGYSMNEKNGTNLIQISAVSTRKESFLRVPSDFLFGKQLLRKQLNPYSEEQMYEPTTPHDYR